MPKTHNDRTTFGYTTFWLKGNLDAMVNEFDDENRDGIAASGNLSIKKDDLPALMEYLQNQPDKNGYVSLDLSLFFADEDKVGDLRGTVRDLYVKPEGSNTTTSRKRSL